MGRFTRRGFLKASAITATAWAEWTEPVPLAPRGRSQR